MVTTIEPRRPFLRIVPPKPVQKPSPRIEQPRPVQRPTLQIEQPRPFTQFAKDDYKKELESRLVRLQEDLEQTTAKKSGGTRSKKLKHLKGEIEKVNKELVSLKGFNSFIDKDEPQNNGIYSMDLHFNSGLFRSKQVRIFSNP